MIILALHFHNKNYYWWAGLSFIPMLGFSIKRLNYSRIKSVEPPKYTTDKLDPVSSSTAYSRSLAGFGFTDNIFMIILAMLYTPFAIIDLGVQISKLTKSKMKENPKEATEKSTNIK
jgi:hypothetical protein